MKKILTAIGAVTAAAAVAVLIIRLCGKKRRFYPAATNSFSFLIRN